MLGGENLMSDYIMALEIAKVLTVQGVKKI
jgi:hypothetical protein